MLKFLSGMIVMAALGAWLTNPSRQDAEAEMRAQLMTALASERLDGKTAAETAALLGCRINPAACFDLVRAGVELTYEDRHLYSRLDLEGFGRKAKCYGLFTRFICPGGLQES